MTLPALTLLLFSIAILIFWSGAFFRTRDRALLAQTPSTAPARGNASIPRSNSSRFFAIIRAASSTFSCSADALVNVPLVVLCLFLIWEGPLAAHVPQWLAATVIFAIVVLLCDLIPKLLALSAPYRLSTLGVFTFKALMPLARSRRALRSNSVSTVVVDRLTPRHLQKRARLSDEELETLVEMGEEQGTLHEAEGEMIQEIIKLGDKTAKDCMTPRVDTFALPDDLTNEEAIAQLKQTASSPRPGLCGHARPDPRGHRCETSFCSIRASITPRRSCAPSFVPETMKAMDLLRNFLTHPQGLAIVVDEFGGTEGIITLSDIIEEIMSDAVPLGRCRSLHRTARGRDASS